MSTTVTPLGYEPAGRAPGRLPVSAEEVAGAGLEVLESLEEEPTPGGGDVFSLSPSAGDALGVDAAALVVVEVEIAASVVEGRDASVVEERDTSTVEELDTSEELLTQTISQSPSSSKAIGAPIAVATQSHAGSKYCEKRIL